MVLETPHESAAPAGPAANTVRERLERHADAIWMRMYQRAMRLRARDMTGECALRSALVLAPHPDDETLGCGATIIAKRDAGSEVRVVFATDGRQSCDAIAPDELAALREREALAACAELGVAEESVVFLGIADGTLAAHTAAAARRIAALCAEMGPDEVFVCCERDAHADHKALHALVADLHGRGLIRARIFEYPIWTWSFDSWQGPGEPFVASVMRGLRRQARFLAKARVHAVSTHGRLERKRRALHRHRTQMGTLQDAPDLAALDRAFVSRFFGPCEIFFEYMPPAVPARYE